MILSACSEESSYTNCTPANNSNIVYKLKKKGALALKSVVGGNLKPQSKTESAKNNSSVSCEFDICCNMFLTI